MYEDSLLVFSSDNGGTQDPVNSKTVAGGNNYPLRGAKHSVWQGGMRTSTFVSGGLIPEALRGSTNNGTYHPSLPRWPVTCPLPL
jgi:arylsulfatase B